MILEESFDLFTTEKRMTLEWYRQEMASIRSGRVTPEVIAQVPVEYYGSRTPLLGLASISNLDARTLAISPWDRGAAGAIAKALTEANLGGRPTVDREVIRLSFPELTTEARAAAVKVLHRRTEEARVRLRQARDEALRKIRLAKESGDATEDDFYDGRQRLDAMISEANDELEVVMKRKEADLQAV